MSSWTCPVCRCDRALIDFSEAEPQFVGCLECDWHKIVNDNESRSQRCTQPTAKYGGGYLGRCSRWADINGQCWQHADKGRAWDNVYARFRNAGDDDIPEAYREIFERACVDAGLIAREERNEQRMQELRGRATDLQQRRAAKPSVVYFIRREGLIKIGTTTDLKARLRAIGKGGQMPKGMTVGPVELLATTPGDRDLERRLHRQFAEHRITGTEWFESTPRLLRLIARYQRRSEEEAA